MSRADDIRYKLNRVGDVIIDRRTYTDAFINPMRYGWETGFAVHAPRKSSPAREAFRARRRARRHPERAIHAAAVRAAPGDAA